jgi:hypothetical protein
MTRRRRIAAEALQNVGAIQAGGTHTHQDAIESYGRGVGDFAKLEAFNAAE